MLLRKVFLNPGMHLFALLSFTSVASFFILFLRLSVCKNENMSKIKNITRMEYKSAHGWWVRFSYNKKCFSKFFNDTKYGGRSSALLAAVAWKKNTKAKHNIPDSHLQVTGAARSNTGVCGVSLCTSSQKYFVTWCDANGKSCATSFSINKYGKEKAFALACEKRKKQEEWRLNGNVVPDQPGKPKRMRDKAKYSNEQLIEILREKYQELGRVPTSRDFRKTKPNYGRFEGAFGGWNKAIKAAGLR